RPPAAPPPFPYTTLFRSAALARAFWSEGWTRVIVFALAMATAEWLRGHVLTGFPWNAFGYALTPTPLLMQSAAVVGLWGLPLARSEEHTSALQSRENLVC